MRVGDEVDVHGADGGWTPGVVEEVAAHALRIGFEDGTFQWVDRERVRPRLGGGPAGWGRRLNGGVAVALGLLMVVFLLNAGLTSFLLVPMVVVLWAYLVAVFLLVEWAVLRVGDRGSPVRRHPELPLLPARWQGGRAALAVLVALVVVVTLSREGAFGDSLALGFWWTSSQTHASTQTQSSGFTRSIGDATVRLRGNYVACTTTCQPAGAFCEAFDEAFECDDDHPDRSPTAAVTNVGVTLGHDTSCPYVPLYKEADSRVNATLTLSATVPGADVTRNVNLTHHIDHEVTGFSSCRRVEQDLGRRAAVAVAGTVRDVMASH